MGQLVSDVETVLDSKKSKKEAKNQRQQILAQMAADEVAKNNLVKKALATQRAKYGASGMSSRGITEGAVLRRLRDEAAQPYEDKKRANIEKLRKIKTTNPNLVKTLLARFDKLMG